MKFSPKASFLSLTYRKILTQECCSWIKNISPKDTSRTIQEPILGNCFTIFVLCIEHSSLQRESKHIQSFGYDGNYNKNE